MPKKYVAKVEHDSDDDSKKKPRVKLPKMEHQQVRKDSVKDIEEIKKETGADEVVRVSTVEEAMPYYAQPGTVVVTSQQDIEATTRGLQGLGLKYLGHGL